MARSSLFSNMTPTPLGALFPSTSPSRTVTSRDLHTEIESSGHELPSSLTQWKRSSSAWSHAVN
jgi:hypothetical protein